MDTNDARERMVQEWGLQDLSSVEQDDAIDKIGSILYQNIAMRATSMLNEEQVAELDSLTEQKGEAFNAVDAMQWLRERVPGFDAIAAEETAKLKERIISFPGQQQ